MQRYYFRKAKAVWAADRAKEMNCELCFRSVIPWAQDSRISLASSGIYRLWVNGKFAAAGPARAAHGYFRVDEYDLAPFLKKEENVVVAEVVGYNVNTYDTLDQPSFLTAEILQNGLPAFYTGGGGFAAFDRHERIQKVQRYSFQRAFIDAYEFAGNRLEFYTEAGWKGTEEAQEVRPHVEYLVRQVRYPCFEILEAKKMISCGKAEFGIMSEKMLKLDAFFTVGEKIKGFPEAELSLRVSEEGQTVHCISKTEKDVLPGKVRIQDGYALYELEYNASGFFRIFLDVVGYSRVFVFFDEILTKGDIDFLRTTSCNCFFYRLWPGSHCLMSFAPYTMKYIKVAVQGDCEIRRVSFVEYKHPPVRFRVRLPKDRELNCICRAAVESFRANAVDIFTDCPSRERGGWLCDSYFTSSVERVLTGESVLEEAFLENFVMNRHFAYLPEGMLPMCYPADHNNGNFIPNWAMWFVLELKKFQENNPKSGLMERAKPIVWGILEFFCRYENQDGLLENLPGWVFVEWSRASDSDVVRGVNFPTNMLYYRMLLDTAAIYADSSLLEKAEKLRRAIRRQSLNGYFYLDNAESKVCTEVCQYYAFFTGVADFVSDKKLKEILITEFEPDREEKGVFPDIPGTNAFIGKYLRIQFLYEAGMTFMVLDNIKAFFLPMAEKTGTLWEHDKPSGSLNHGFASYVLYWLAGIFGVVEVLG